MEIGPIREVRAIGAASTPKAESEIQPPFAFYPAARMEDDAYDGKDHPPERGLEEEDPEEAEEPQGSDDQSAALSNQSDSKTNVNFFA
ncbi:MAG TPA: hypothetical protein VK574_06685 [Terracidiphilus sp.]|jgi:hypothetical protein|nr:hypothetical protein [Terracidiphilus sp.]